MARLRLLPKSTITAAATLVGGEVAGVSGAGDLTIYANFVYGSGGTACKVYVQTTIDGTNWFDIACMAFATTTAKKLLSVSSSGDYTTPATLTDAALADDTVMSGVLGQQFRVKVVSTGTYAGATTITVDAELKEAAGGGSVTISGSSAVTLADGADATLGAKADAAAGTGTVSVVSLLKYIADLVKIEDIAHVSGDKGLLMLGVANASLTTNLVNTDGDNTPIAVTSKGALHAYLLGGGSGVADGAGVIAGMTTPSAGYAANGLATGAMVYNGSTWDRQRGNIEQTVGIVAAGVTTTQTGADQTNYNWRGVKVVFDMTVVGTGSVTLSIQGKDTASGKYYTILAGAAVITNVTNVYTVYPGAVVAANVSANDVLPRTWRVLCTANNANATTYSVAASMLL